MPTDGHVGDDPVANHLRRMSDSVHELSARIARLATSLGVDLENEAELERVMHIDAVRVPVPDRRATPRAGMSMDRRKAHLREELRGLLVLRYGVARSYVDRVGVDATRHIFVAAHEQLVREGFKPGAAGASMRRLFDAD